MKKMNKKGFTLAELLIVVAIIAVLVAISIPIFSSQLERSREAVDAANIRAAYAEAAAEAITGDKDSVSKKVTIKQTTAGWDSDIDEIAGVKKANLPEVSKGDTVVVTVTAGGTTTITKE